MSDLREALNAASGSNDLREALEAARVTAQHNALDGFKWETANNPAAVPDSQRWCVRNALCSLMGWSLASPEARSIPAGPPATDLKRLCDEKPELGLAFHDQKETVPGATRGIVVGQITTLMHGIQGHAEFAERIGDIAGKFDGIMGVIAR
jgi:hypothetical protein